MGIPLTVIYTPCSLSSALAPAFPAQSQHQQEGRQPSAPPGPAPLWENLVERGLGHLSPGTPSPATGSGSGLWAQSLPPRGGRGDPALGGGVAAIMKGAVSSPEGPANTQAKQPRARDPLAEVRAGRQWGRHGGAEAEDSLANHIP